MKDNIKHPSHYTTGDIEVIDYIRDKLTPEEFTGYCIGNVIKYVSRWRHKGGTEDLKKAEVYLNWAIEHFTADFNYDVPEPDQVPEYRGIKIGDLLHEIMNGHRHTCGGITISISDEDED